MSYAEETKQQKAMELRYRKPIVRNLNYQSILDELYDIQEQCENVHWYFDTDDETLLNALDGNAEEEHEFRMMFADLYAECNQMWEDLQNEWVPECFDKFFVAAGAGRDYGGILGYDSYEQDYLGLSCTDTWVEDEAAKSLKSMKKDELIAAIRQCFRIYESFISLRHRYDCLKTAMDILKSENTEYLQTVKKIDELYNTANDVDFLDHYKETKQFNCYLEQLPQEAWVQ